MHSLQSTLDQSRLCFTVSFYFDQGYNVSKLAFHPVSIMLNVVVFG